MKFVDPECAAIASAFARRKASIRLPGSVSTKNPMYRRSGASYDLKSIREYQAFDDPRAIDWKLYGRSDRAFVKEFYDEADEELAFLVDSSASIGCLPVNEYLSFIGSLSYILLRLGIGVRLWTYTTGISRSSVVALSPGAYRHIEAALSALHFSGSTDGKRALAQWRSRSPLRRVFIFSDFHEASKPPAVPVSGRLFMIRSRAPFSELVQPGSESEVVDPETGKTLVVPWNRDDEAVWNASESARDARLARLPRAFYRRLDRGKPRAPVYWDILESLYA
ncbi:MAG: DUF58 domain-containing protein [Spirochaetia bacterium]|nr:DUF58 domain-containing protein [Spirochaetia bacterium]